MSNFFFIVHVAICVLLIAVILFQDGKAGGLTSVSESSQSVFGARGAASFLTKLTSILAFFFFASSVGLHFKGKSQKSIASDYTPPASVSSEVTVDAPATTDGTAPESAEAPAVPASEDTAAPQPTGTDAPPEQK